METYFLIVSYCGSYSCNSQHPIGIFHTEAEAKLAIPEAKALHRDYGNGVIYPVYQDVDIIEISEGEVTEAFSGGCH